MTDWLKSNFYRKNDVYLCYLKQFELIAVGSGQKNIADAFTHWAQFHMHTALQPKIMRWILQLNFVKRVPAGRFLAAILLIINGSQIYTALYSQQMLP